MAKKKLKELHQLGATVGPPSSLESKKVAKPVKSKSALPEMVSTASDWEGVTNNTTVRRDIAGSVERTNRFTNIENGLTPYRNSSAIYGNSAVDIRDAVILCQKCYWNFSLFRNIIDLMGEFSIDDILWTGGNKQSRAFFEALFNKIGIWQETQC